MKKGAPQAIFAVVISLLCFVVTYAGAKMAGYDVGLAAGLWGWRTNDFSFNWSL
ncbi:hypothetical protein O9929_16160 [Vibrio lentus]|nr:hypothetical protein [Vibrio lentus]